MCLKMSWSWENMHFDMNQSRKRREEEAESVIRDSTKEFDFFFWWEREGVKSKLRKTALFIKRRQHCSGMTLLLPIKDSIDT